MKKLNTPAVQYFHYQSLSSTNQKLYHLAEKGIAEWTVVWCDEQTRGKGHAGNEWKSVSGKNLTFSFLLRKSQIRIKELAYLNMWVSMVLQQTLSKWQFPVKIKWPNDILLSNKKIAGILIENKLSQNRLKFSVIGIGLNVYQKNFENLPQASSLAVNNPHFNTPLKTLLEQIVQAFQEQYHLLEEEKWKEIKEKYQQHLYKKNQVAVYELEGNLHNGILEGVTARGEAQITLENQTQQNFKHKEIFLKY